MLAGMFIDRRPRMTAAVLLIAACLGWGAAAYLWLVPGDAPGLATAPGQNARLASAKQVPTDQQRSAPASSSPPQALHAAKSELTLIREAIAEAEHELHQLESDRRVAETRADRALDDVRAHVRSLTEISRDLTTLSAERLRLQNEAAKAERRLSQATLRTGERIRVADELDRQIAQLALQEEALRARLAEQPPGALVTLGRPRPEPPPPELAKGVVDAPALAAGPKIVPKETPAQPPAAVALIPNPSATAALAPRALEPGQGGDGVPHEPSRTSGLYRFSSLPLKPSAMDAGPALRDKPSPIPGKGRWVDQQYQKGRTLLLQGEQRSGTRELFEAVLAFKAVLREWRQEADPSRWAMVQNDLGHALALLGARTADMSVLEEAAEACRAAMAGTTPHDMPLIWGEAHHGLGLTLAARAELDQDAATVAQAREALNTALRIFEQEGARQRVEAIGKQLHELDEHPAAS